MERKYEDGVMKKECTVCKQLFDMDMFNVSNYDRKTGKPIHRGYCKSCQADKDKESRLKRMNKSPDEYKVCPDCNKELHKKYFSLNRGSTTGLATYCKSCFAKRDRIEKVKEQYRAKHSHNEMARYNKKKELLYDLTLKEWNECLSYFDHSCVYCGVSFDESVKVEYEHFIPMSKDGGFTASNILPACKSCNASKNNKDYDEWAEIKGLESSIKHNILMYFDSIKTIPSQIAQARGVETIIDYPNE